MKLWYILFLVTLTITAPKLWGQHYYGLKNPEKQAAQKCRRCLQAFRKKPKEVQFKIEQDDKDNLYFVINNRSWFHEVFTRPNDGIAVDIVPRGRYDCNQEVPPPNGMFRGALQRPVYAKKLLGGLHTTDGREYQTLVGKLPKEFKDVEVEFNIIFFNENYICRYFSLYKLKSYPLELLDMGLYLDTIVYEKELKEKLEDDNDFVMKYKEMNFKIPFEQDKSIYFPEDIKPLYDSLRLTNYTIKKIDLKAFSSVEGTLERNIQLQEERAQSIVKVLQSYQKDSICTTIQASENWVEFLNDIAPTSYAYMLDWSKAQIKEKLNTQGMHRELEIYLKNHRKALVKLKLQRKDSYSKFPTDTLLTLFDKAIELTDIQEAEHIQNVLFEKLKDKSISPQQLTGLQVPEQIEFAHIRNKSAAFNYFMDAREAYISFLEMRRLLTLLPKDKKIWYNYCALKFKVWRYVAEPVNPQQFLKEIKNLITLGIPKMLVNRMLINYHVVKSDLHMRNREFFYKDQSVKFIYDNYKKLALEDDEALNLAQYFTWYANNSYTLEVLSEKVKKLDVSENLLFYYLNHTLVNKKLTRHSDYRTIMLNAIAANRLRFCALFDTHFKGGVTFQLLENKFLRKTYCENCEGTLYQAKVETH